MLRVGLLGLLPRLCALSGHDVRQALVADYDKSRVPTMPTEVTVQFYISSMNSVDQKKMEYTIDIFFRLMWDDPRLNHTVEPYIDFLPDSDQIWKPDDMYFFDAMRLRHADHDGSLLWVDPSGRVTWSRRMYLDMRCHMDFSNLPFDDQSCPVYLESYATDADHVSLKLAEPAVQTSSKWGDMTTEWSNFNFTESEGIAMYSLGPWSYVQVTITMERTAAMYLNGGMLPAVSFVIVSYCGFYITAAAAPARIALAVICVVIVINSLNRYFALLPVVGYPVFLIDFMLGCFFFNIFAIFEYAFVNYAMHRPHDSMMYYIHREVDRWMKAVFPLGFFAFNLVLWNRVTTKRAEVDAVIAGSIVLVVVFALWTVYEGYKFYKKLKEDGKLGSKGSKEQDGKHGMVAYGSDRHAIDEVISGDGGAAAGLTHEELEEMIAEGEIELTEELNHGDGFAVDIDPTSDLSVSARFRQRAQVSSPADSPSSGKPARRTRIRDADVVSPRHTKALEAHIASLGKTIQRFERVFSSAADEIATARATVAIAPIAGLHMAPAAAELGREADGTHFDRVADEDEHDAQIYQCCTVDNPQGARPRVPSREKASAPPPPTREKIYGHRF
jgi:gamma-aminobutyric acid receptor subunit rho